MMKRKQQPPETQLAFVIQTPSSNSTKNNAKLVRSHAARLRSSRRHEKQVKSWILKKQDKSSLKIPDGAIPGRVGTNLSLLDFPEPLKPYMENDMFRWFHGMGGTLYPQEICLQINALHSSWTTNLLIDKIYFHAVLFSIETYFNPQGTLSHFHFAKTLRLLQERLDSPDQKAISDATIMVVVMLGLSAELIGDSGAAEKHVDGLKRIVELRGGLEGLRFDNPRLPAKVCRVDLGLVLRFGCKPVFFTNEDISWNPYLPPQVRMKKTTQHPEAFIKTLDPRLANVWKDLQEFSTLSNLAYQTDRKLQPNTFSEIMISILYRLVALTPENPVENAIRLGMMTFTASIFFRWRDMKQRQAYLDGSFRDALGVLRKASVQSPRAVVLWLLVLWEMNINGNGCDQFSEWACEVLRDMEISSWDGIREILKTVIWIDCLFDTSGRRAFEPILAQVSGQPRD